MNKLTCNDCGLTDMYCITKEKKWYCKRCFIDNNHGNLNDWGLIKEVMKYTRAEQKQKDLYQKGIYQDDYKY